MLGGGYVNYFSFSGRSYKVIPQVEQKSRLNTEQLSTYYIRAADGTSVPLSTIATITTKAVPQSLNHFQQMNAATISGVAFPGVGLGDALDKMEGLAKTELPGRLFRRLRWSITSICSGKKRVCDYVHFCPDNHLPCLVGPIRKLP